MTENARHLNNKYLNQGLRLSEYLIVYRTLVKNIRQS